MRLRDHRDGDGQALPPPPDCPGQILMSFAVEVIPHEPSAAERFAIPQPEPANV